MDAVKRLQDLAKRIKALEDGEARPLIRPKAYVLDYQWEDPGWPNPLAANIADLAEQTASFVVNAGTLFLAREISYSVTMVGQLAPAFGAGAVQFTLGPAKAVMSAFGDIGVEWSGLFSFEWKVRDTGTDREWTNNWTPAAVLMSGSTNGLVFGQGRGVLGSGAELFMSLRARRRLPLSGGAFPLNAALAPTAYKVQVVFHGEEVVS